MQRKRSILNPIDAKTSILPHTKAKLDLYENYLKVYLAILGATTWIKRINIFDIFCGTGVYKHGKAGSPIRAFECIKQNRAFFREKGWLLKEILLSVNDGNPKFVENVESYLTDKNKNICKLEFNKLDAKQIIMKVIERVNAQPPQERNLVFIDPYGYKNIHKDDLEALLTNRKTEVIMFLPISFMYRFRGIAVKNYESPIYESLRNFIYEFFLPEHPILRGEAIGIFDFIRYLKVALSFSRQFYSSSFYLQRDASNYYSLFFIGPSLLGLEKIIQKNWELDKWAGEGFDLPKKKLKKNSSQLDFLSKLNAKEIDIEAINNAQKKSQKMERLKKLLRNALSGNKIIYNTELREIIITNGFQITQATSFLREWREKEMLEVWDCRESEPAKKKSYFLGSKYNSAKRAKYRLLNQNG